MNSLSERVKETLSMRAVVERYGYVPNRAGYIRCPFHREKTPSLKIYDKAGRGFYCYGCGKGGSIIDFVMEEFHVDFRAATVRLASDFGIVDMRAPMDRKAATEAHREAFKRRELKQQYNLLRREFVILTDTIHASRPFDSDWADAIKRLPSVEAELEWLEESGYGR